MKKFFVKLKTPAGMVALAVVVPIILLLLGMGVLSALHTAYQGYRIVSGSMEPALLVGDRVLIDKVSYIRGSPERGDIALYHPPESYRERKSDLAHQLGKITGLSFFPQDTTFLHRIVAIPGDKVEIKQNEGVFVNGEKTRHYLQEPNYSVTTIVVPSDSYYLLGDNINNAADSHMLGFIPRKDIIGKVASVISREATTNPADDPKYAE